ncbi:MAG: hypothetical protein ACFFDF_13200 [Candidatus Odinarchaeota archaeon]
MTDIKKNLIPEDFKQKTKKGIDETDKPRIKQPLKQNIEEIKKFYTFLAHETKTVFQVYEAMIDKAITALPSKPSNQIFISQNDFELLLDLCNKFKFKGQLCLGINERPNKQTKITDKLTKINVILFDIDVKKGKKVKGIPPATLKKKAEEVVKQCKEKLEQLGFTIDLIVDSGNGYHIYVKVSLDIPEYSNKEEFEATAIYNRLVYLENELRQFNTDNVEIDFLSKDVMRRVKIPGTYNIKRYKDPDGKFRIMPKNQWRMAKILYLNENINEKNNNKVFSNLPIEVVEKDDDFDDFEPIESKNKNLNEILEKDEKLKDLYNGNWKKYNYKSRSEAEEGFITKLVYYNFTEPDIYKIMDTCQIGKWQEKTEAYRKHQIKNATKFLEKKKKPSYVSVIYGRKKNSISYADLQSNGIYLRTETKTKDNNEIESDPIPLWIWKNLDISMVLLDEKTDEITKKFNFNFNGQNYKEKTFLQMKKEIELTSCIKSGNKQVFGVLIDLYITQNKIPEIKLKRVCGFTNQGWIFPPEYYINFNQGIQDKFKSKITKTIKKTIDHSQIEHFKKLYRQITADYKDIIFAYGIVAPFLYALKKYTNLQFYLTLYSPIHETGKSAMAYLITKKFWNSFVINSEQLNSPSRARDFLSASTFPISIDETEKLKDHAIDMLKSMATMNIDAQYKKIDQSLGMDKPLCTSVVYTFNTPSEIFNDIAYISRGLFLKLNKVMSPGEQKNYIDSVNKIENGMIGKYIIEKTKDLTLETLETWYREIPNPKNKDLTGRQVIIFKLLHLGKKLFYNIFQIELDLSKLEKIIIKSGIFGADDIFEIVKIQCEDPDQKCIQAPLISIKHDLVDGYFYGANNLQDLKNRLNIKIAGVSALREILVKRWTTLGIYKSYKVQGKSRLGFFIPESLFE